MIFNQNFTRTAAFDIVDPYASPLIGYGPDSGMILLTEFLLSTVGASIINGVINSPHFCTKA
jgi:hypothetical protein